VDFRYAPACKSPWAVVVAFGHEEDLADLLNAAAEVSKAGMCVVLDLCAMLAGGIHAITGSAACIPRDADRQEETQS